MSKKLAPDQVNQIIFQYTAGKSPKEIGEMFGIRNNSVTRILRRHEVVRDQLTRINSDETQEIIQFYQKGVSSEVIALRFGRDASSICRLLKKNGVALRSPTQKKTRHKSLLIDHRYDYGTFYIPEFKGTSLSTKNIEQMTDVQKQEAAKFVFDFYRANGFPYPTLSNDELLREFSMIRKLDTAYLEKDKKLSISNFVGAPIFKHFSPHYFEMKSAYSRKPSIVEAFNDDKLLMKTINNRLARNHNIHGNMIKQGLRNSHCAFAGSIFNVSIAKHLYNKYTADGDIIYDYSMGFGQRLLAALSLNHRVKYVGVDPLARSVKSNQAIFDFYHHNVSGLNKDVHLVETGSEDFIDEQYLNKVAFAFSSPPYFNLEIYEENDTQAYVGGYNKFINNWWAKTVDNVSKLLKKGGRFGINVALGVGKFALADDMRAIVEKAGFELEECYQLVLSQNLKFKNKQAEKLEPIFIYKKK